VRACVYVPVYKSIYLAAPPTAGVQKDDYVIGSTHTRVYIYIILQ